MQCLSLGGSGSVLLDVVKHVHFPGQDVRMDFSVFVFVLGLRNW